MERKKKSEELDTARDTEFTPEGLYTYVSDLKFLKHVRGGVRSAELTEFILVKKVEFSL